MTTNEKINFIIQMMQDIQDSANTIGELPDYTGTIESNNSFIAIYNSNLDKTLKISVQELGVLLANIAVQEHDHEIGDINNLGSAINQTFIDSDNREWSVKRNGVDYDFSQLKVNDIIFGFEDFNTNKSIYINGVVLDANIDLTTDLYDTSKFFIITKKIRL